MFPVDVFPPVYFEERAKDIEARQKQHDQPLMAVRGAPAPGPHAATPPPEPASPHLAHAPLQRPPLSRPTSSSLFGNLIQGFKSPAASRAPSRAPSPSPSASAPKDAAGASAPRDQAEKMREADIVCHPPAPRCCP